MRISKFGLLLIIRLMKFSLLFLLLTIQVIGHPQDFVDSFTTEIQLSHTLNESRMGLWEDGDYQVYIDMRPLEDSFRNDYLTLIKLTENQYKSDTAMFAICILSAERYLAAANQLKQAEDGFNLKSLVVYVGRYNEEQTKGSTLHVHELVKQFVEEGNAAVFYKGKRIYTLKKTSFWGSSMISAIKIYSDQSNSSVFSETMLYMGSCW